jgi:hypothetical protein
LPYARVVAATSFRRTAAVTSTAENLL